MNEKIREAFEQVQAEEELKNKTKEFIRQKTKGYQKRHFVNYKRLAAAVCTFVLLVGGYRFYFIPTAEICIDINPAVALGVNRFNRIVTLQEYNDDGKEMLESMDLKYMNYKDAVNEIIESDQIADLLSEDMVMTIAVAGQSNTQSEKILSDMQACTSTQDNTYCYYAHPEEVEKAREAGLSYGKYKACLKLQELDPSLSMETMKQMTMQEIRDRIRRLSDGEETTVKPDRHKGYGGSGERKGSGQGKSSGQEANRQKKDRQKEGNSGENRQNGSGRHGSSQGGNWQNGGGNGQKNRQGR